MSCGAESWLCCSPHRDVPEAMSKVLSTTLVGSGLNLRELPGSFDLLFYHTNVRLLLCPHLCSKLSKVEKNVHGKSNFIRSVE